MECRALSTELICRVSAGLSTQVIAHYEYRTDADGGTILYATRYTEADGITVVTPLPGDIFTPGSCSGGSDFDNMILCDPANAMAKVIVVVTYDAVGVPTATAYNLDGSPWVGDIETLVECPSGGVESDAVQMCDNNVVAFLRWFIKENGVPTGVYFDTTLAGAPYVPVGPVTIGACGAPLPDADCAAVISQPVVQSTCDRPYDWRTTGGITGVFNLAAGAPLRSFTIMSLGGAVTITNYPGAPVTIPANTTVSFSAPSNGQGEERGYFSYLPAFDSPGDYMILWVEGN